MQLSHAEETEAHHLQQASRVLTLTGLAVGGSHFKIWSPLTAEIEEWGCTFACCPTPWSVSLLAEASSPAAGAGTVPWGLLLLLNSAPAMVWQPGVLLCLVALEARSCSSPLTTASHEQSTSHAHNLPSWTRQVVERRAQVLECERHARQPDSCEEFQYFMRGCMPHLVLDIEPLKVRDVCFVGVLLKALLKVRG